MLGDDIVEETEYVSILAYFSGMKKGVNEMRSQTVSLIPLPFTCALS